MPSFSSTDQGCEQGASQFVKGTLWGLFHPESCQCSLAIEGGAPHPPPSPLLSRKEAFARTESSWLNDQTLKKASTCWAGTSPLSLEP